MQGQKNSCIGNNKKDQSILVISGLFIIKHNAVLSFHFIGVDNRDGFSLYPDGLVFGQFRQYTQQRILLYAEAIGDFLPRFV